MDFPAIQVPNRVYPLFRQTLLSPFCNRQSRDRLPSKHQESLYHPNSVCFGENGNLPNTHYTYLGSCVLSTMPQLAASVSHFPFSNALYTRQECLAIKIRYQRAEM